MMDGGLASGAKHWTESALSRMLREVRLSYFQLINTVTTFPYMLMFMCCDVPGPRFSSSVQRG